MTFTRNYFNGQLCLKYHDQFDVILVKDFHIEAFLIDKGDVYSTDAFACSHRWRLHFNLLPAVQQRRRRYAKIAIHLFL